MTPAGLSSKAGLFIQALTHLLQFLITLMRFFGKIRGELGNLVATAMDSTISAWRPVVAYIFPASSDESGNN